MEPTSFLDQIERLRTQAQQETDTVLKKEHKKTIRHLYKQYRRATKHRHPWFGFLRITFVFFVIFILATWAFLHFTNDYGWWTTIAVATLTAIVFSIITATMLRMLKFISEDIYKEIVDLAVNALGKFKHDKTVSADEASKDLPLLPLTKHLDVQSQSIPQVTFDVGNPALPGSENEAE